MSLPAKVEPRNQPRRAVVTSRNQEDLSDYFDQALTRLGIQNKEIAICWHTSEAFVSLVRSGQKPLPDYRIAQLEPSLRLAVIEAWAEAEGLIVGPKAALSMALQGIARLAEVALPKDALPERADRMLKAELPK